MMNLNERSTKIEPISCVINNNNDDRSLNDHKSRSPSNNHAVITEGDCCIPSEIPIDMILN